MSLKEVSVVIPETEAVAVEYPGFVRNTGKAVQTLGGLDSIAAAVSSKQQYLKLKHRPEDRTSHPLYGERHEHTRLLLRIARPRQQQQPLQANQPGSVDGAPAATAMDEDSPQQQTAPAADAAENPAAVTASIVARIAPTFRFPGLADFAFIPHDPLMASRNRELLPYDQRPDRAEPTKAAQPFLLIPQLFSWLDLPQDYAFRQLQSKHAPRLPGRAEPNWGDAPVISFYAEGIPPPVTTTTTTATATATNTATAAAAAVAASMTGDAATAAAGAAPGAGAAATATAAAAAPGNAAVAAGSEQQPAQPMSVAAVTASAAETPGVRAYRMLEAEVSRLLAQRPVWGLELMRERCSACSAVQTAMAAAGGCDLVAVERVMQRLCYRFKTGPWRGLFIRRGYDPRTDVGARKYQAVIYSLPNNWYRNMLKAGLRLGLQQHGKNASAGGVEAEGAEGEAAAVAVAGGAGEGAAPQTPMPPQPALVPALTALAPSCLDDLHNFRALPTQQSTTLQLVDLQLKEVQDALQDAPSPVDVRCSEKTGWFNNATLQFMQNAIQQHFLQLMDKLAPPGVAAATSPAAAGTAAGRKAAAAAAAAAASAGAASVAGGGGADVSGDAVAGTSCGVTVAGDADVEMEDATSAPGTAAVTAGGAAVGSGGRPAAAADEALRALMAQMNLRGLGGSDGGTDDAAALAGLFGSDDEDDGFRLLDEQEDGGAAGRGGEEEEEGGDEEEEEEEEEEEVGDTVGRQRRRHGGRAAAGRSGAGAAQRRGGGGGDAAAGAAEGRLNADSGGVGVGAGEMSDGESAFESEYDVGLDDEDEEDEEDEGLLGAGGVGPGRMYDVGAYGRVTVAYDGSIADQRFDGGGTGGMFGSDDEDEPY